MKSSNRSHKKVERRGRPRTGRTPLVTIRLPEKTIDAVDRWAMRNFSRSRSQAIRDLIESALGLHRSAGSRSRKSSQA